MHESYQTTLLAFVVYINSTCILAKLKALKFEIDHIKNAAISSICSFGLFSGIIAEKKLFSLFHLDLQALNSCT